MSQFPCNPCCMSVSKQGPREGVTVCSKCVLGWGKIQPWSTPQLTLPSKGQKTNKSPPKRVSDPVNWLLKPPKTHQLWTHQLEDFRVPHSIHSNPWRTYLKKLWVGEITSWNDTNLCLGNPQGMGYSTLLPSKSKSNPNSLGVGVESWERERIL